MIKTKITSLFLFTLFCSLSSFSQNSDKTVHDSTFNALNKVKIEQLDNALENSLKLCESEEDTSKIVDQASKRWELEMNKNYQKVLNGGHEEFSSPDVIKELKKTQEAWLKFKAQELALITHYIYVKDNKNQRQRNQIQWENPEAASGKKISEVAFAFFCIEKNSGN